MYVISGVPAYSIDTEIVAKIRLLPPDEQKMIEGIVNAFLFKKNNKEVKRRGKSNKSN